jgi:hypothetical protein
LNLANISANDFAHLSMDFTVKGVLEVVFIAMNIIESLRMC